MFNSAQVNVERPHTFLPFYSADELRGLQWDTRYLIIKGICEGLHYLHMKKRIIHMDLKPGNILIDHNMVAKITDFGLSKMMENSQTKITTPICTM
jgi:interleukin-1 receptor-associated kinase 1/coatomer subunit beta'